MLVDPARGTPAGRGLRLAHQLFTGSVPWVATAWAGNLLYVREGHCWCWWIRLAVLRRGGDLRLAHQLSTGSVPWVATAGAGAPVRGIPAGPVAGLPATDWLDVRG